VEATPSAIDCHTITDRGTPVPNCLGASEPGSPVYDRDSTTPTPDQHTDTTTPEHLASFDHASPPTDRVVNPDENMLALERLTISDHNSQAHDYPIGSRQSTPERDYHYLLSNPATPTMSKRSASPVIIRHRRSNSTERARIALISSRFRSRRKLFPPASSVAAGTWVFVECACPNSLICDACGNCHNRPSGARLTETTASSWPIRTD
jgi:hypothetical protein